MSIATLPFFDLHRHLDGNVRISTIISLAKKHQISLPSFDEEILKQNVFIQDKTSDLLAFLEKLDVGVSVLADIEACEQIAYENIADAHAEGLTYVELRFSPFYMAKAHQLDMREVVGAVVRGCEAASKTLSMPFNLIGILSRTFGTEACMLELEALLAYHQKIAGLDLAGDEYNFPATMFKSHFDIAKSKTDWRFTIHAGEASGAQSVWDAIHHLHADRIGHGVRAIEDESLLDYIASEKIGIESCLTSNYQTGTWLDTKNHPVKLFLSKGIRVCLNTDDPGVSNIRLNDEFDIAKTTVGLSDLQCQQLLKNAINISYAEPAFKQACLSKF
uniref:adenosine deaminase n=1 Tax=Ningiella ruwaisensis TaxID=2364274 RepID=UPI0015D1F2A7|nr:adenosine deaminase [Ningiella ruwaisensis]